MSFACVQSNRLECQAKLHTSTCQSGCPALRESAHCGLTLISQQLGPHIFIKVVQGPAVPGGKVLEVLKLALHNIHTSKYSAMPTQLFLQGKSSEFLDTCKKPFASSMHYTPQPNQAAIAFLSFLGTQVRSQYQAGVTFSTYSAQN